MDAMGSSGITWPEARIALGWLTFLALSFPVHPPTVVHQIIVEYFGEPVILNQPCENPGAWPLGGD